MMAEEKKVSKTTLKTAEKYHTRMRNGEKMMRDSRGRIQWADGRGVGYVTYNYLVANKMIRPLDTDLFGDSTRGQTIGISE